MENKSIFDFSAQKMAGKVIAFGQEARLIMQEGLTTLAKAVKVTLGSKGRFVAFNDLFKNIVTKDGVTVAKQVEVSNPIANLAVNMVREVSERTAEEAGDGTTTSIVLAEALYNEGLKYVSSQDISVRDLKMGMEAAGQFVIEKLKEIARPINDEKSIKEVAALSANGDKAIGELVAEAIQKVNKVGVVTIEESNNVDSYVEIVEGLRIDRGYVSPYFVTDQQTMTIDIENPYILLVDKVISNIREAVGILETVARINAPVVVMSDDITGEALAALIMNKMRAGVEVAAVRLSYSGQEKEDRFMNISVVTGAKILSPSKGDSLENIDPADLGRARRIRVTNNETIIIGGEGDKEKIKERAALLDKRLKEGFYPDYQKSKIEEQIAGLTSGIAIIRVGGFTETEVQEKKYRIEDALHATRAAIEEGVVPGGGVALIRCEKAIEKQIEKLKRKEVSLGYLYGWQIVYNALKQPLINIVHNAGKDAAAILAKVREMKGFMGYNVDTEQFSDLYKDGIIDPLKVTRLALANAISIASLMLSTECVIVERPTKNKKNDK